MNGVFEIFRHREWEPEIVPELHATNGTLKVVLINVPCLRNRASGARKFAFHHFGAELLKTLCADQFADIEHVRRLLSTGEKTVHVRLRDLPSFDLHLTGQVSQSPEQFCSDLADCLVIAFRGEHLVH